MESFENVPWLAGPASRPVSAEVLYVVTASRTEGRSRQDGRGRTLSARFVEPLEVSWLLRDSWTAATAAVLSEPPLALHAVDQEILNIQVIIIYTTLW